LDTVARLMILSKLIHERGNTGREMTCARNDEEQSYPDELVSVCDRTTEIKSVC
jgi:hypothetical protein